jgi:hypothetical protein
MAANAFSAAGSGGVAYGVMGGVETLPAGFSQVTVLQLGPCDAATGRGAGVGPAADLWGERLLAAGGKRRGVADADFTTNYLAYSSDNGAFYYYHTEQGKDYQQTLADVKHYAVQQRIPYRHWLMDSWWYFKGPKDGVKNWTAMPSVFPGNISAVTADTQWPIVAHNRWWSGETTYAKQNGGLWDFVIDPDTNFAVPLQQEFWDFLISDSKQWGLATYEQDWPVPELLSGSFFLQCAHSFSFLFED